MKTSSPYHSDRRRQRERLSGQWRDGGIREGVPPSGESAPEKAAGKRKERPYHYRPEAKLGG